MEQFRATAPGGPVFTAAPVYQPYPYQVQASQNTPAFLGLAPQNAQFWKGVALGAAVTVLLTNESVQKGIVTAVARMTAAAQSGIEEIKEKFEDAKAEAIAEAGEE